MDKAVIRFSDGSVYNLRNLPAGLKEGRTYQMQWQEPYVIGNKRLVIIAKVD